MLVGTGETSFKSTMSAYQDLKESKINLNVI